jgi:hypothetical protein
MKTKSLFHCLRLLFAAALLVGTTHAQTSAVPDYISYQGRALNADGSAIGSGTPVNRNVTFRIWDHASNALEANLLYSEQQVVTISNGEFSVLIGAGAATPGSPLGFDEASKGVPSIKVSSPVVFAAATRYLGVTIDDGTAAVDNEISPRQQFVSSSFAFRAKVAESVENGAIVAAMLDNNVVDSAKIVNDSIYSEDIKDSTITSDDIQDGQILQDDLADNSVSSAKIIANAINTNHIGDYAVLGGDLGTDSVDGRVIVNESIYSVDIKDNTITSADIADGTITSADIANGTITGADLGTNTITTEETLRIVRGAVNSNGTRARGEGFSVERIDVNGVEQYHITFTIAFNDIPTVNATLLGEQYNILGILSHTPSKIIIVGHLPTVGWNPIAFNFTAIGTR